MKVNLDEIERKARKVAATGHGKAASPAETLALVARIRKLESAMRDLLDEVAVNSEDPEELEHDRALLAEGVILS